METPKHTPFNMAPSTVLTPPAWRHVLIHPDGGGRFKLTGHASATVWLHGDLKALGVHVKAGKVWGLTKDRALEIGALIEAAMVKAEAGHPLPKATPEPPPKENRSLGQKPKNAPPATDQASFL